MAAELKRTQSTDSGERKYQLLSRATIKLFADSKGYAISDDVIKVLTEDVNYRLREIVSEATQYLKHSKRSRLSVSDVNHALADANVSLYCTEPCDSRGMQYVHIPELSIHTPSDLTVNLSEFVGSETGAPRVSSNMHINVEQTWINTSTSISQPAMNAMKCHASYFTEVTEAVVSHDLQLRQLALADVICNPRISHIKEQLLTFINNWCSSCLETKTSVRPVLELLDAFTNNSTVLYTGQRMLDDIVSVLVDKVCLNPVPSCPDTFNDDQTYSADILSKCLQDPMCNQVKKQVVERSEDIISNLNSTSTALHGALKLVINLNSYELMELLTKNSVALWLGSNHYEQKGTITIQSTVLDGISLVLLAKKNAGELDKKVLEWASSIVSQCPSFYTRGHVCVDWKSLTPSTTVKLRDKCLKRVHTGVCVKPTKTYSVNELFHDYFVHSKKSNISINYGEQKRLPEKSLTKTVFTSPMKSDQHVCLYRRFIESRHSNLALCKDVLSYTLTDTINITL